MTTGKSTIVIALCLAVSFAGVTGCAGKKKAPVEQKPVVTAPEQKPAPAPRIQEPPKRVEERVTVPANLSFTTVYFDYDKSDIRSDQQSTLSSNAQLMSRYETVKIRIEGHCDERGTDEYNIALGQRRADSVKNFFVNYGISSSRVETISYGESRPVASGSNEAAWSKNRRAESVITAK